ncbi:MAG: hypothetical protein ABR583_11830 [Gaiellaceae bacterium]
MTCRFDLAHYRELLRAAATGGYRYAFFDREPAAGDLFLRHDVDLSLDAAVVVAELEAEEGAAATYFLMTESVFYNLASPVGRTALARICGLGHRVGLHAAWPDAHFDERFDPVLAWHNPDPPYMSEPVEGAVNVMQPPWFMTGHYRSDSNQHWRSGCPHQELERGEPEWLQLLVHPEIWTYPGATMRETMFALLEAERGRRLELMAEDRIDLS